MISAVRVGVVVAVAALGWQMMQLGAGNRSRECVPLPDHPGAVVCGGVVDRSVVFAASRPTGQAESELSEQFRRAVEDAARQTEAIPAWMPRTCRELWPLFTRAGNTHGISPTLLSIVSLIESGCGGAAKTSARNGVILSSAGAAGLMQIIPSTAQGIASNRGLVLPGDWRTNDAVQADYGAWLLAGHMRAYGKSRAADPDYVETIRLSCIAYNGGGGAVMAYRRGSPYAESLSHSGFVVGMWQERRAARSPTFELWRDAGGYRWVE